MELLVGILTAPVSLSVLYAAWRGIARFIPGASPSLWAKGWQLAADLRQMKVTQDDNRWLRSALDRAILDRDRAEERAAMLADQLAASRSRAGSGAGSRTRRSSGSTA